MKKIIIILIIAIIIIKIVSFYQKQTNIVYKEYSRDDWKHWIDEDGDGQDTRQEVLIEESLIPVTFDQKGRVKSGKWHDPYTGKYFTNPSDLDVDHVVPLKYAHDSGGHKWSAEKKMAFANELDDKNHLIAVSKSANRSKGSKSPLEWLPTNEEFIPEYISIWISIKEKWGLDISKEFYKLTNTYKY